MSDQGTLDAIIQQAAENIASQVLAAFNGGPSVQYKPAIREAIDAAHAALVAEIQKLQSLVHSLGQKTVYERTAQSLIEKLEKENAALVDRNADLVRECIMRKDENAVLVDKHAAALRHELARVNRLTEEKAALETRLNAKIDELERVKDKRDALRGRVATLEGALTKRVITRCTPLEGDNYYTCDLCGKHAFSANEILHGQECALAQSAPEPPEEHWTVHNTANYREPEQPAPLEQQPFVSMDANAMITACPKCGLRYRHALPVDVEHGRIYRNNESLMQKLDTLTEKITQLEGELDAAEQHVRIVQMANEDFAAELTSLQAFSAELAKQDLTTYYVDRLPHWIRKARALCGGKDGE